MMHFSNTTTVIHSDSQGSIALSKNPEHHARSKHIDIRHHFIREQVAANHISLQSMPTEDMLADAGLCIDLSRGQVLVQVWINLTSLVSLRLDLATWTFA